MIKWFRSLWRTLCGRCSECGSDNIHVYSVKKATCKSCGAEGQ